MTPFDTALRLTTNVQERPGGEHHPAVVWAHELAGLGRNQPDETAWCGSITGWIAWLHNLERPKRPAAARDWLTVGDVIERLDQAECRADIVIFRRGDNPAHGHVGFYAGHTNTQVFVYGGNQGNRMSLAAFPVADLLGIRRLRLAHD